MLGYRRDLTASTLRRADRSSASIGLIIEDVSNPFFSAVHRGVEDVARPRGVLTFVGSSDEQPERERELAEAFGARGVDGLVIVPCAHRPELSAARAPGRHRARVRRPSRRASCTATPSSATTPAAPGAAVEHLIAAGPPPDRVPRRSPRRSSPPPSAAAATCEALAAAGIERMPELERGDLTHSDPAERATLELLESAEPPTALFTGQNLITIGAIRALREAGRQREVALVGFDDVVLGDLVEPGVTVVAQDPYALGRHAGELLFARLRGEHTDASNVVVPTRLIERGSGEIPPV